MLIRGMILERVFRWGPNVYDMHNHSPACEERQARASTLINNLTDIIMICSNAGDIT